MFMIVVWCWRMEERASVSIQGLSAEGVRFSACGNTIKKMGNLLGEEPQLNPNATRVDAGVVRIIDLTSAGYTLVKP